MQELHMIPITWKMASFAAPAILFQAADIPNLNWVDQIQRTGLIGVLLVAVSILWKSNSEKDKQITSLMGTVTAAMTQQVDSNVELRKIIEESVRTKTELKMSIDALSHALEIRK